MLSGRELKALREHLGLKRDDIINGIYIDKNQFVIYENEVDRIIPNEIYNKWYNYMVDVVKHKKVAI